MSGADEDWVKAAMTDDAMVVELLVRLHRTPPPRPRSLKPAVLPLEWSVRQRRSKSVSVSNNPKKPAHRGSPTTPLSWSGATSFSGGSAGAGGVGSEESSRPIPLKLSTTTRSKVTADCEKIISKRSRKKKTLAELKDEENLLLKERRELKREVAALRVNLERERANNENLKRMKIELQPNLDKETTSAAEESISGQLQQEVTAFRPVPPLISDSNVALKPSTSDANPEETATSDHQFILPDLNIPFDEPGSDAIRGVS
ncbi:hypothetical protein CDL12_21477 [Handroanthus impetiginosus]|uniref:BZIP domain-containing protein n=1 Tax=Handroanthus impetiginosus TaxID=429701 RepID=A0A2G9GKZ6_9LAMI|nr:hypothetical protein CDL12_21477 [Handroanthus impetiginosus]